MKKTIVVLSLGMAFYATSCLNQNEPKVTNETGTTDAAGTVSKEQMISRGQYLVNVIGCGDCHTPKKMSDKGPVPDMDRFLSGFNSSQPIPKFDVKVMQKDHVLLFNPELTAAAGPWGVSFAANLTPDETGIGNWTLENFKTALRKGKYKGMENSRDLLPPMPWPNFKNLSDADLEAMFHYLKSIKPINNRIPNAIPPGAALSKS